MCWFQKEELIKTYSIENPTQIIFKPRKIPNFKISGGISFDRRNKLIYLFNENITDLTNCPQGSYHVWVVKGKDINCKICNTKIEDATGKINRLDEAFYYNLNKITNRRCLNGTLHDFAGKKGQFVCTKCHHKAGEQYNKKELDILNQNLDKLEDEAIKKMLDSTYQQSIENAKEENEHETLFKDLTNNYKRETANKLYGQIIIETDKLIKILETFIGVDVNLDISKYPVYLRDDVYIIDHTSNGALLNEPIILTQKDNRIFFKENQPFFKTDIYYYTDNKTQTDIFYHAVTLKLLGYKEKHKDYVKIKANAYLKISPSIKNRLLTIGYETKYIDIGDIFVRNSKFIKDNNKNYFQILDGLIRDHIFKTRTIVDKISSIIYKIKYYQSTQEEVPSVYLQNTQLMDKLITKFSKIIKDYHIGKNEHVFDDWNEIRDSFTYHPINWEETNVRPTENLYVNSDLINYYDIASNTMVYYLVNGLIAIIESNSEKITKINISQLYVEIIAYVFNIYNVDSYKNSLELKRFEYILNGSEYMIDILKRGQGLLQSKELEEQIDDNRPDIVEGQDITEEQAEELEDLKEEAEALDIELDYYAEEDEDYALGEAEE